ncbi:MAG: hypothetical protein F6K62_22170 [Sphaerospermopsis sp. SIO1G2]|nr:hypothetical protein [Sphaerospermopsis sp. SIO1G2]
MLTWKGNIVWDTNPNLENNKSLVSQIVLPDPSTVISASVDVNYKIDIETIESTVNELNGSIFAEGFVEVKHLWGNQESFDGSVSLWANGLPTFEGDLIRYQSSFLNTSNTISASNLILDELFSFHINYEDFFSTQQINQSFEGQINVSAKSSGKCCTPIPESSSPIGLLTLGLFGTSFSIIRNSNSILHRTCDNNILK